MTHSKNDVLNFLMTRRSHSPKTLTGPAPDDLRLRVLLTAAARTPDHGALVPWRFIVLKDAALSRIAGAVEARGRALGKPEEMIAKNTFVFSNSPLCVAVIYSRQSSDKVPEIEQKLSAGAVCLSLVNAALADGWGAGWVTGWMAYDTEFLGEHLGLGTDEFVAGFVHIGSGSATPPERPRPDVNAITEWVSI